MISWNNTFILLCLNIIYLQEIYSCVKDTFMEKKIN